MDLLEELRWRGLLFDATEGVAEALAERPLTGYIGFDPSAPSLHVGSLLQIMLLVHLQRHGHAPIALVGGGTGLIGDPSGKTQERQLLTRDEARANAEAIRDQLARFLDFERTRPNPAVMRDNLEWLGELRFIDFLRDTGKFFSVNGMLRKESVRRRLEQEETGISYTEFSYMLLQAYDFLALYDREGCTLQLGGSDQWGNITAGIDLIRRQRGIQAHGVVSPLVTSAGGVKFGKTEAGAVWLDPGLTSPFRFYQFWLNQDDRDAGRYLRYFTLLPREEISALERDLEENPAARTAQRRLAQEVTGRVHGAEGLARAEQATEVLFGGELQGLDATDIEDIFADVPATDVDVDLFEEGRVGLVELLAATGLASSKSDARRALEQGGIYLNNRRVQGADSTTGLEEAIEGRFLVLRRGRKSYHLVRLAR